MASLGGVKASQKRTEQREEYWSGSGEDFWHRTRSSDKGFSTIPRTLPLVMVLLEHLGKGKDLTRVYLDLWSRLFDEGVVEVTDQADFAYASGFAANRGVRSWRERIKKLEELGFVKTTGRWDDDIHYILVVHPDKVIQKLDNEGKLPSQWKARYEAKLREIGAQRWSPPKPAQAKGSSSSEAKRTEALKGFVGLGVSKS